MKNYQLAVLFFTFCSLTCMAQTVGKSGPLDSGGKTLLVTAKPPANPIDAIRTAKLIYVKSSSLLVGASVVEEKLLQRNEFHLLGLMVTRDEAAADIVLELHHDRLTKYVYTAIDPRSNVLIAGGKLSSLGGTVAEKVAERFLKQLVKARQTTAVSSQ